MIHETFWGEKVCKVFYTKGEYTRQCLSVVLRNYMCVCMGEFCEAREAEEELREKREQ